MLSFILIYQINWLWNLFKTYVLSNIAYNLFNVIEIFIKLFLLKNKSFYKFYKVLNFTEYFYLLSQFFNFLLFGFKAKPYMEQVQFFLFD